MRSGRQRQLRARIAAARRDPADPIWQQTWNEIATRYRRGELSDAEYDRLLSEMP